MERVSYVLGIDEVGRGPLAGPVAVGVTRVPVGFDWQQLPGVTDSKKISAANRTKIFTLAQELQSRGAISFVVSMVSASVIDRVGIVSATNLAMARALARVTANQQTSPPQTTTVNRSSFDTDFCVKLDAGLRAPARYQPQETIIKGDASVPEIGLASIVAKVHRDRYMSRLAQQAAYAPYQFHTHKGYGTRAHRALIEAYGLSDMHRRSYCKNMHVL